MVSAINQESRGNIRGSPSCGEMLGAEEEASRMRESLVKAGGVEALR